MKGQRRTCLLVRWCVPLRAVLSALAFASVDNQQEGLQSILRQAFCFFKTKSQRNCNVFDRAKGRGALQSRISGKKCELQQHLCERTLSSVTSAEILLIHPTPEPVSLRGCKLFNVFSAGGSYPLLLRCACVIQLLAGYQDSSKECCIDFGIHSTTLQG